MVKYVVEDGFSKIKKTGIGQYTLMIENILSKLKLDVIEIEKNNLEKIKNKIIRRIFYSIWLNTIFLLKLLFIKGDIVVFFTNFTIPVFKLPHVKYIPVIHDLTPIKYPECTSKAINIYEKNNILNAIKNNDYIITVSYTVKNEIIETFNISPEKVFVVYNTVPQTFINNNAADNSILKKYGLEPKKYILSVATLNKRKNIPMLINAFNEVNKKYPDIKLVLIGGMGSEDKSKLNANENVIFTGYIEDNLMPVFYKNALLYVYPSIYEGFGIPLIEAQYCGCPVICSDIPVFREIADACVHYFNLNKNSLANAITEFLKTPEILKEIEINQNLEKYMFSAIVNQVREVLKRIV